jgi:hypothetical protein
MPKACASIALQSDKSASESQTLPSQEVTISEAIACADDCITALMDFMKSLVSRQLRVSCDKLIQSFGSEKLARQALARHSRRVTCR